MEIFRFSSLAILGLIISCSPEKSYTFELPTNAMELLSGDSSKTWILARRFNNKTRMNMGDCFLAYAQTFRPDGTMNDNAGENRDCGETLNASWRFIKSQDNKFYLRLEGNQVAELLNIEEDFKHLKILALSDTLMTLQFSHKQFSNKATQITDFWVPEGTKVEDRFFHW